MTQRTVRPLVRPRSLLSAVSERADSFASQILELCSEQREEKCVSPQSSDGRNVLVLDVHVIARHEHCLERYGAHVNSHIHYEYL